MTRRSLSLGLVLALICLGSLGASPQGDEHPDLMGPLVQSYDLLEAGNLAEARKIYEELLVKFPENPLVLNNLAAIYVREKDYQRALNCLERALPKARGYKLLVNRLCDVDGICLAFRPAALEYGAHDLEPLIALNIDMVKAKFAASQKGK